MIALEGPPALLRQAQDGQPAAGTNVIDRIAETRDICTCGRRGRRPSNNPTQHYRRDDHAAGPPGTPRERTGVLDDLFAESTK